MSFLDADENVLAPNLEVEMLPDKEGGVRPALLTDALNVVAKKRLSQYGLDIAVSSVVDKVCRQTKHADWHAGMASNRQGVQGARQTEHGGGQTDIHADGRPVDKRSRGRAGNGGQTKQSLTHFPGKQMDRGGGVLRP
jgi:hypothetical protein